MRRRGWSVTAAPRRGRWRAARAGTRDTDCGGRPTVPRRVFRRAPKPFREGSRAPREAGAAPTGTQVTQHVAGTPSIGLLDAAQQPEGVHAADARQREQPVIARPGGAADLES